MDDKAAGNASTGPGIVPEQLMQIGKERTDAIFHLQNDVLDAYQEASRAWADRMKAEVDFWSELTTKLSECHSVPAGFEAYRDSVSHRMQMAAEDAQYLVQDSQKMIAAVRSLLGTGQSSKIKLRSGIAVALQKQEREECMERRETESKGGAALATQPVPRDWAKLIRKLRWLGLDEEAERLECAASTLPPEHRCGVSLGPFSTD